MRLIGYARTSLPEDVGERDLEEQERGLAEYCLEHDHELLEVITEPDEPIHPAGGLTKALTAMADGIVITDPLVVAQDKIAFENFSRELLTNKKHLVVIMHDKHIDPSTSNAHDELLHFFSPFINTTSQ